ncbi:MAG TPA: diguanylate cyclase [Burkholderiales bacterium]|nr:diguanylate cyclase [Burkholderiales bacterium]
MGVRGRIALLVVLAAAPGLAWALYLAAKHDSAIAGLVILALLVAAAGWWGAEIFVAARLGSVLGAAQRLQGGDYAARTGLTDEGDELARLGSALDQIAGTLQANESSMQQAVERMRERATSDPVSGLANRHFMEELLTRDLLRAARKSTPLAVIMLSLERFEGGDEVLQRVGALLKSAVRGSDIACHYAAGKFLLVLSDATAAQAKGRGEQIGGELKKMGITTSFGAAGFPEDGSDVQTLLRCADRAASAPSLDQRS